jgi:hypothetical protein
MEKEQYVGPKYTTLYEKVAEMQKSVTCLALELPEAVHDDVSLKWNALKTEIMNLCPRDHDSCQAADLVRTV